MPNFLRALSGLLFALAFLHPAYAADLKADPSTIAAVLKAAAPGDVVKASGGVWPFQNWGAVVKSAPGITIEPAAGEKVTFAGLRLSGAEGITIRGVDYASTAQQVIQVTSSKKIAFRDCEVSAGNTTSDGIWFRWSSDITVSGCRFHNLRSAIFHQDPTNLLIENVDIREVYSDGIRGGANGDGITIRGARITDQHLVGGDHLDGIQFWTSAATKPTRNVLIEDVVITRGSGSAQQGLQIGNESGVGYENLVIRNVAVIGGLYNGISISGAKSALVEDVYIQPMVGATDANGKVIDKSWIMFRSSTGGVIRNSYASLVNKYVNVTDPVVENFTPVTIAAAGDYSGLVAWQARNASPVDPKLAQLQGQVDSLSAQLTQANVSIEALKQTVAAANAQIEQTRAALESANARIQAGIKALAPS